MLRLGCYIIISLLLIQCNQKGPQTFSSDFIGNTKEHLIGIKGPAHRIKIFQESEAYIYVKKEDYYGKNIKPPLPDKPKRSYEIEYIYYINSDNIVYKYQVWKKRIK